MEGLRRYTANTITDAHDMERELALIRSRGYAIDNYERFDTGRGIAVPVLDPDGRPVVAMLCLGQLDPDPDRDLAIVQQMLSLAREVSDHLRATGDMPAPAFEPKLSGPEH